MSLLNVRNPIKLNIEVPKRLALGYRGIARHSDKRTLEEG
jgi:hypothetical protein